MDRGGMKRDEEEDENEGRSELILQHVKDMDNDNIDTAIIIIDIKVFFLILGFRFSLDLTVVL